MDNNAMFLDCPEYMNDDPAVRCGLPAEVVYRYAVASTDGPLESAKILCPRHHWFNGPIASLSRSSPWRRAYMGLDQEKQPQLMTT